MFSEPLLQLEDIQGHVLVGFGASHQRLLGLKVNVDQWLDLKTALVPWIEKVSSCKDAMEIRDKGRLDPQSDALVSVVQMSLSFAPRVLTELTDLPLPSDPLFLEGAQKSAFALGDKVDESGNPKDWEVGAEDKNSPDLFLVFSGADNNLLDATVQRFISETSLYSQVIYKEIGEHLPQQKEHFGFVDGISQPAVRGLVNADTTFSRRSYAPEHPLYSIYAKPGQPLVWPGQFVFGYPSQLPDGHEPGEPIEQHPDLKNGSILVFRRLKQDVSAFQKGMRGLAEEYKEQGLDVDAQTLAAWCVGRWPDGTPVSLSPLAPDPSINKDRIRLNGFLFDGKLDSATLQNVDERNANFPGASGDPNGVKCPFFAHIRKVNPRDQAVDQGSSGITLRSQMLRRGIPFGPLWQGEGDNQDRGLLFMAYQTSIVNQFHRLMTLWVNNTFAPPPGEGIDPIIGVSPDIGRPLTRRTSGTTNYRTLLTGDWVTATGAGYFFTPGIRYLKKVVGL